MQSRKGGRPVAMPAWRSGGEARRMGGKAEPRIVHDESPRCDVLVSLLERSRRKDHKAVACIIGLESRKR